MTETTEYPYTRDAEISKGIRQLVIASGTNSRDHGFHDSWPLPGYPTVTGTDDPAYGVAPEVVEEYKTRLRMAAAEKIALLHEEVSEALGEIRDGRDPMEVYYVDRKGNIGEKDAEYPEQVYDEAGVPLLKPEGFLVEIADMMIRGGDLAFLSGDETGEQLAFAQRIKHEYNATRPYKHGRKF